MNPWLQFWIVLTLGVPGLMYVNHRVSPNITFSDYLDNVHKFADLAIAFIALVMVFNLIAASIGLF